MAHEVSWTLPAVRSHEAICQSLADYDIDAALALDKAISEKTLQLADFPFLGAEYELDNKSTRFREVQVGEYRVFYEVNERRQRVRIALVWHSARNEPTLADLRG